MSHLSYLLDLLHLASGCGGRRPSCCGLDAGSLQTGVSNVSDFIWRLCKGCVQLGSIPSMQNVVNACPVDYVARVVCAAATESHTNFHPTATPTAANGINVLHVYHPHRFRFSDLLNCLPRYGYPCHTLQYIDWRDRLMEFTMRQTDNALFPLLHYVLDDLPSSTKAPQLDDRQTQQLLTRLYGHGRGEATLLSPAGEGKASVSVVSHCPRMDEERIGLYLAYLVKVGFLGPPPQQGKGRPLPAI